MINDISFKIHKKKLNKNSDLNIYGIIGVREGKDEVRVAKKHNSRGL